MKKILFILSLTIITTTLLNAQNNYYFYNKGNKVALQVDKKCLNIFTEDTFSKSSILVLNLKDFTLQNDNSILSTQKYAKIEFLAEPNDIDFFQKINTLKQNENINHVSLFFKDSNSTSIGTSNIFYVKLKTTTDYSILQQITNQKNVQIIKQMPYLPEWYVLALKKETIGNSIDLSNYFYETGYFADVDPAFMFDFKNYCSNDTNFGNLWGLNNPVNQDIDINACQAWGLSQGSGINIAVIDTGIDIDHNDLQSNINGLSFDCQTQTSPSYLRPQYSWSYHGTHVAGTIAAIKDNNLQVVGVAPNSKLISVSHSMYATPTFSAEMASGISWAYQHGADIINNSWGVTTTSNMNSAILESAITNAMLFGRYGKGCLIVFASGNNYGPEICYPASFNDNIITVGALNSFSNRPVFSGYGTKLDLVAQGSNILSTKPNNQIGADQGTSMAAPHVLGVCALVIAANPCLSGKQVRDIIEKTSQKVGNYIYANVAGRPDGTWNTEMGYGLVDAYAAVQLAQSMYKPNLDLMVRDGVDDFGIQPNTTTQASWNSPDIWVRNQNDGIQLQEHQNPKYYTNGNSNYIYVRITNKSCTNSFGTEELKIYLAKNLFQTSFIWPTSWNPTVPIGQITIPTINSGNDTIVTIPWIVPDPVSFPNNPFSVDGSNTFSLLTRIVSNDDPMAFPETGILTGVSNNPKVRFFNNVKNNNNIAYKNLNKINLANGGRSGLITIENLSNEVQNSYLELVKENSEIGNPIYEEAEVILKMDDILYNAWDRGGNLAQNLMLQMMKKRNL